MPGGRLRSFRLGDRSELLVEQLLSAFAFTSRVPRQEDIGFDFFCSLISNREEHLLRAGPFFAVQAKSSTDPVIYAKDHEVGWITGLENPLLLCVADRPMLAMDVYSTWNVMCGPLFRKPTSITLLPGVKRDSWPGVKYEPDGAQEICLGPPIVRVTDDDIFDDNRVEAITTIISEWVALDRINIVNRQAGMYWVFGPLSYETGKSPYASGHLGVSLYWHPDNLEKCCENLGRVAASIRLILRGRPTDIGADPTWSARDESLEKLLASFWEVLDESVKQSLIGQGLGPAKITMQEKS